MAGLIGSRYSHPELRKRKRMETWSRGKPRRSQKTDSRQRTASPMYPSIKPFQDDFQSLRALDPERPLCRPKRKFRLRKSRKEEPPVQANHHQGKELAPPPETEVVDAHLDSQPSRRRMSPLLKGIPQEQSREPKLRWSSCS